MKKNIIKLKKISFVLVLIIIILLGFSTVIIRLNQINFYKIKSAAESLNTKSTSQIFPTISDSILPSNIYSNSENSRNITKPNDNLNTQKPISDMTKMPIRDLNKSSNNEISKLDEYQKILGGYVTNELMIFYGMSNSDDNAKNDALEISSDLKEFSKYNLKPLTIIEPTVDGGNLDFLDFIKGDYDNSLNTFFKTLKSNGITDKMLGTWTIFPEANIPEWGDNNIDPDTYAKSVNKYFGIMKNYFPYAETSLLLDSTTNHDKTYSEINPYISLVPYLKNINKNLITSFGLQGFPWAAPANSKDSSIYDPNIYLNPQLAIDAADTLGIKNIWLNTGTFSTCYDNNSIQKVNMPSDQRSVILNKTNELIKSLKLRGFNVSLNLFSEDKSKNLEAIDWSYLKNTQDINILKNFLQNLNNENINFSIYDSK